MTEAVAVAGISSRGTRAALREHVHLGEVEAAVLGRALAERGLEAVVLATCNRTEVYVSGTGVGRTMQNARSALAEAGGGNELVRSAYVHFNRDAALHLFRVAAGLESIVLGDTHVAAQVQKAHEVARRAGATGPLLDRLFEAASAAGKRVRARTAVATGATTVAGAAVAIAAQLVAPMSSRRVLVVGAGTTATLAALGACSRGCRQIVIANRSDARARDLASRVGGRAVALDALDRELAIADIVFACTASREFVLTAEHVKDRWHETRPRLILDLALPRDVDPMLRHLPGVQILGLDDLADVLRANVAERNDGLDRASVILGEEASRWEMWRRARNAGPAIAGLRSEGEQARRVVLERYASHIARLPPQQQTLLDLITKQLVARLLHAPTIDLREKAMGVEG